MDNKPDGKPNKNPFYQFIHFFPHSLYGMCLYAFLHFSWMRKEISKTSRQAISKERVKPASVHSSSSFSNSCQRFNMLAVPYRKKLLFTTPW